MSAPLQDRKREVLPPWRDLPSTIQLGEHGPKPGKRSEPPIEFERLVAEWETERTLPFATELVGAAVVFDASEKARHAALFITSHPDSSPLAVEMAKRVLGLGEKSAVARLDKDALRSSIRSLKTQVRIEPRDAFGLAELSRQYAISGQIDKAIDAMERALILTNSANRYILRSASRLFVHAEEPKLAHRILARSAATPKDPWLLAAEIATARFAGKTPEYVKDARRLVESNSYSYADKSELASSLGTLEAADGALRRARQLFRASLVQPTSNAVAQARWANSNHIISFDQVDDPKLDKLIWMPEAHEARAWHTFYGGEWEQSRNAGKAWLKDQPFAASPAVHTSYVLSVAEEDYSEAIRILQKARIANPNHPTLLNNLAFALANAGELNKAEDYVKRALSRGDLLNKPSLQATSGLIAFRRGDLKVGSQLYEDAIREASEQKNPERAAKARLFYALEALRAKHPDAIQLAEAAFVACSAWKNSDFEMLQRRLQGAVEVYLSNRRNGSQRPA